MLAPPLPLPPKKKEKCFPENCHVKIWAYLGQISRKIRAFCYFFHNFRPKYLAPSVA